MTTVIESYSTPARYEIADTAGIDRPRTAASGGQVVKGLFDRAFAALALVLITPALLVIVLVLALRGGGPVLFSHERVGRDGRTFRCLKFRTMIAEGAPVFDEILRIDPVAREDWASRRKIHRDPRIDRLGSFLRKASLDELPQFWNVLRGDMSMVGPRPITDDELAKYGRHAPEYLSVRPGLTGLWQVSGRSNSTYAERVALDVDYIRNQSLGRDLSIVMRTFGVVLLRKGAM